MATKKSDKFMTDVSVIINVHNQLLSLILTLKSLQKQTYSGNLEIIIVDDGSSIDTIKNIFKTLNSSNIQIKYVWQQDKGMRENVSFNNGIDIARGTYLIFLAGDMVPDLNFVQRHLANHTGNKVVVTGNRLWRGLISEDNFKILDKMPIEKALEHLESDYPTEELFEKKEKNEQDVRLKWLNSENSWRAGFACNLSVRKNEEIYFDENYIGWGNYDQEFTLRLMSEFGYSIKYDSGIHAFHLETGGSFANIYRTRKHKDIVNYLRNTCYFFDKYPGLNPQETYLGFSRFVLDPTSDSWQVQDKPKEFSDQDLAKKVEEIRTWLTSHDIYPFPNARK